MIYGDRDLYAEWQDKKTNETYGEYVKRESIEITNQILEKYSFLLKMGYKDIQNIDNHIVRFEKIQNNCTFSMHYGSMNTLDLHVYYQDLPTKLMFNGDGEYDECISVRRDTDIIMDKENISRAEMDLIIIFNEELEKLKI